MNLSTPNASPADTLATICFNAGVSLVMVPIMEAVYMADPEPALYCPEHFNDDQRAELGAMMMDQFFPKTEAA